MREVAEEKQGQQQAAGAPRPGRSIFLDLLRAGLALEAFCLAFSLTFLLSRWGALGDRTVRLGTLALSPVGIGAGVVVGAVALALFLKRFGDRLGWYKPHQATLVRSCAFGCLAALTFYGCWAFYYQVPSTTSAWWDDLWRLELFGKSFALKPILFPSASIFLLVMTVAYLLLNRQKWADFLIDTEGELKKVSWPRFKESAGSATVVVVVVVVISLFLFFVDKGLSELMKWWGVGF